ncbi:MAG: VWA domain-containing protein, partial [Acidobacteriota bacterium]
MASESGVFPWIYEERVAVDRVLLPVTLQGGDCDRLEPRHLNVREDGEPVVRVTAIERRPRPAIHALLIDVSDSMKRHDALQHAIDAAKSYVRGLRDGERVMILAFDEQLHLRVPLTAAPDERALQRIESRITHLEPGERTSLRDAVFSVLYYLSGLDERKAIVVLTDGVDVSSRIRSQTFIERVSDLLEHDVAVFPVALNVQPRTRTSRQLQELASLTGGAYFALTDEAGRPASDSLLPTFELIRELLHDQVVVEYDAFDASEDRAESERERVPASPSPTRRRLEVSISDQGIDCRVLHAASHRSVRTADDEQTPPDPVTWPPSLDP